MKPQKTAIDKTWSLFLDRDGVLNKFHLYPPDRIENFEWIAHSDEALVLLSNMFKYIFVVTNQSGIAQKYISKFQVETLHRDIQHHIDSLGGKITEFYYCPHLPRYLCKCRKPKPKMALDAFRHYSNVDFKKSIMIGDRQSDILFGKRLGMKTVLIAPSQENFKQDMTFGSLWEFALYLSQSHQIL